VSNENNEGNEFNAYSESTGPDPIGGNLFGEEESLGNDENGC